MKSDARKSSARSKASAPADQLLAATEVNSEVADADYATQLLTAAEALNVQQADKPATAKLKAAADAGAVVLPAQCLMRDVVDLKKQLVAKLDMTDAVKIDVKQLERIDAAALQLLLAFVSDRSRQQRAVEWLGINEVMMEATSMLGLESLLRLPVVGAA